MTDYAGCAEISAADVTGSLHGWCSDYGDCGSPPYPGPYDHYCAIVLEVEITIFSCSTSCNGGNALGYQTWAWTHLSPPAQIDRTHGEICPLGVELPKTYNVVVTAQVACGGDTLETRAMLTAGGILKLRWGKRLACGQCPYKE